MQRQISNSIGAFQGSSKLGLLIALALAVATGIVIYAALQSESSNTSAQTGSLVLVPIVSAGQPIPAGTRITPGMLEITEVSEDSLLGGTATSLEQVSGSYARIPILQGEPILQAKLTQDVSAGSGLSFVIPEGRRALGIRVDRVIGAGGLLRPGDRVDIFAVIQVQTINPVNGEIINGEDRAVTIAQNIEVLAVEQELLRVLPTQGNQERTPEAGGALPDQADAQPASTVATLALTPDEARLVLGAEESGVLRLGLRGPGDTTIHAVPTYGYDSVAAAIEGIRTESFASLAFIVPEGHRAMAVTVDKVVSAGGLLRPGDHVDLLAVLQVTSIGQGGVAEGLTRSVTLVQNLEVLAVEQALEDIEQGAEGQALSQPSAQVVTLAVTPSDAQSIFLAEMEGTIRLAVRAPGDDTIEVLPATAFFSVQNILGPAQLLSTDDTVALLDR
jgi:pilus assembly protein CpaB